MSLRPSLGKIDKRYKPKRLDSDGKVLPREWSRPAVVVSGSESHLLDEDNDDHWEVIVDPLSDADLRHNAMIDKMNELIAETKKVQQPAP